MPGSRLELFEQRGALPAPRRPAALRSAAAGVRRLHRAGRRAAGAGPRADARPRRLAPSILPSMDLLEGLALLGAGTGGGRDQRRRGLGHARSRSRRCWRSATRRCSPTSPTTSGSCPARCPARGPTGASWPGSGRACCGSAGASVTGGVIGAIALLELPESAFDAIVPVLILLAVRARDPAAAAEQAGGQARGRARPRRRRGDRRRVRLRDLRRLLRRRPGRAADGVPRDPARRAPAAAQRGQERARGAREPVAAIVFVFATRRRVGRRGADRDRLDRSAASSAACTGAGCRRTCCAGSSSWWARSPPCGCSSPERQAGRQERVRRRLQHPQARLGDVEHVLDEQRAQRPQPRRPPSPRAAPSGRRRARARRGRRGAGAAPAPPCRRPARARAAPAPRAGARSAAGSSRPSCGGPSRAGCRPWSPPAAAR